MSIYSSITLSRSKALEIVMEAAATNDDDLHDLVNDILQKYTFRNVYRIVPDGDAEAQDDDPGIEGWRDRNKVYP